VPFLNISPLNGMAFKKKLLYFGQRIARQYSPSRHCTVWLPLPCVAMPKGSRYEGGAVQLLFCRISPLLLGKKTKFPFLSCNQSTAHHFIFPVSLAFNLRENSLLMRSVIVFGLKIPTYCCKYFFKNFLLLYFSKMLRFFA
jgi:hypothetical protein